MATIRPGMLEPCIPDWNVKAQSISLTMPANIATRVKLLGYGSELQEAEARLETAAAVIGIGLGFVDPENIPVARELADVMDGALAATLPAASRKWLASQVQLGLTGKAVAPRFYLAIGVSGQPNHLVGVRKSEHIIAINNDSEAPIFKSADFGIVGDWAEIVPALTRKIKALKTE